MNSVIRGPSGVFVVHGRFCQLQYDGVAALPRRIFGAGAFALLVAGTVIFGPSADAASVHGFLACEGGDVKRERHAFLHDPVVAGPTPRPRKHAAVWGEIEIAQEKPMRCFLQIVNVKLVGGFVLDLHCTGCRRRFHVLELDEGAVLGDDAWCLSAAVGG